MTAIDRTGFIGGSDIAAIIGVSPWRDAHAVYLEKVGELPPDPEETKVQRRGRILERAIAELYREEHGAVLARDQPTAVQCEYRRAQIDAWEIAPHGNELATVPLEIKSASEFTRGKWGPSGSDEAPTYYCTQVHWQIALTDAPFGRLVALLGADDLRVYTIPRDETVIKFLVGAAAEFWQRVLRREPPDIDYQHPRAADVIARLFREVDATEILQATDSERHWRDVMQEAAERAKQYEAVREGAKAHLLHTMRNASVIDFGDGTMFERKIVKRSGYTVEPCEYIDARVKKVPAKSGRRALPQPEEV